MINTIAKMTVMAMWPVNVSITRKKENRDKACGSSSSFNIRLLPQQSDGPIVTPTKKASAATVKAALVSMNARYSYEFYVKLLC